MNTSNPQHGVPGQGFQLRPGDGWLFYQAGRENIHVFQGHLRLDDTTEVQVQAQLDTNTGKYTCTVREFGTWKELAVFDLPQLGNQAYVESEFKLPLDEPIEQPTEAGTLKITHRKYQVRAFKGKTNEGESVLRMRLPQVRQRNIVNRNIPM